MYTPENYYWGIAVYIAGVLLMAPFIWKAVAAIFRWRGLTALVRLMVFTFLLVPVRAYPDMDYLAPAWVVMAFEFIRPSSIEGPARAIAPLVMTYLGLVIAYIGWRIFSYKKTVKESA
jgi:hypothetical protein